MLENLLMLVVLAALLVSSYIDLKSRKVPDWISYGLIFAGLGLRLIDSISISSYGPILYGIIGLAVTFALALLMFYTGIWGGGDSKILMGLGAVIGLDKFTTISFLVLFIFASFIVSGIYGIFYALYLASKHWKSFKMEFGEIRHKQNVRRARIAAIISVILSIILFFVLDHLYGLFIMLLAAMAYLTVQSWIFMKAIEKSCLINEKDVDDLVEGDWIVKVVIVKNKKICGPKELGLTKHQIGLLKKYRIKKVIVKDGIPFVPSFLIAYLISLFANAKLAMGF